MDKPKPFLYKVIAEPKDFTSSSSETKIIGVFNPGVTTVVKDGKEKTLLMIRVAEAAKKEPKNAVLLPYFDVEDKQNSQFKIKFDKVEREENVKSKRRVTIGKKEVSLENRLARLRHISYPLMALSNGVDIEWKEDKPGFYPCYEYERFGIEDPRIVKINDTYVITYVSPHREVGVSTSIALTKNFKTFKRFLGRPIFAGMKDVIPFPEQIKSTHQKDELGNSNLHYAALTRHSSYPNISSPGIWVAYSPDLIYWGNEHRIITSGKGETTGTGAPVVKLDDMWLGVYHEVELKPDERRIYRGALFGLDLKRPERLLYRTPAFIEPNRHGLKPGYSPDTYYPTGLVVKDNVATIYAGEDDSYISVSQYYLEDLVKYVKENSV